MTFNQNIGITPFKQSQPHPDQRPDVQVLIFEKIVTFCHNVNS